MARVPTIRASWGMVNAIFFIRGTSSIVRPSSLSDGDEDGKATLGATGGCGASPLNLGARARFRGRNGCLAAKERGPRHLVHQHAREDQPRAEQPEPGHALPGEAT